MIYNKIMAYAKIADIFDEINKSKTQNVFTNDKHKIIFTDYYIFKKIHYGSTQIKCNDIKSDRSKSECLNLLEFINDKKHEIVLAE